MRKGKKRRVNFAPFWVPIDFAHFISLIANRKNDQEVFWEIWRKGTRVIEKKVDKQKVFANVLDDVVC